MYNDKPKFTRLTLEQNDRKIVWEIPYDDPSGEDMMQAIRTIMIGMTFSDLSVESSMASYLQEHSNEYEVLLKSYSIEEAEYEEIIEDGKE